MVITMENITIYIAVVTFTAAIIKTIIIDPLKESINKLSLSVDRIDQRLADQDRRLVVVEQSTKSAHKRLNTVEERLGHE